MKEQVQTIYEYPWQAELNMAVLNYITNPTDKLTEKEFMDELLKVQNSVEQYAYILKVQEKAAKQPGEEIDPAKITVGADDLAQPWMDVLEKMVVPLELIDDHLIEIFDQNIAVNLEAATPAPTDAHTAAAKALNRFLAHLLVLQQDQTKSVIEQKVAQASPILTSSSTPDTNSAPEMLEENTHTETPVSTAVEEVVPRPSLSTEPRAGWSFREFISALLNWVAAWFRPQQRTITPSVNQDRMQDSPNGTTPVAGRLHSEEDPGAVRREIPGRITRQDAISDFMDPKNSPHAEETGEDGEGEGEDENRGGPKS